MNYSTEEEMKQMQEDMKFDIDEKFAEKIDSYRINKKNPWTKAIKKACFVNDKWYHRLWKWVKGLFGVKPKKATRPQDVEINPDFDFQSWVLERHDIIIKAIKEDGKDKNTITCPICYNEREYYLAPGNKHIHSNCEYCGIRITQ